MTRSSRLVLGSVVLAIAVALIWLHAPLLPTLLGGGGAGALLLWRGRSMEST
jgi:hypothetical protein